MIVCDTGPLVALSNERDDHYFTANNLFRDLHMAGETLVLPPTVLAETCYWLDAHGGAEVEAAFLEAVADGTFQLVDLPPTTWSGWPIWFASTRPSRWAARTRR